MAATENMTTKHLKLLLGPAAHVTRVDGSHPQRIHEWTDRGVARAPYLGPVVFQLPIVLPKTTQVVSCHVTAKANLGYVVRLGQTELAAERSGTRLKLNVEEEAGTVAEAELAAEVEFLAPVESGADYFNYIMTQA